MALRSKPLVVDGKLKGTTFTFESAGDELPVHAHGHADIHYSLFAHGSVRLLLPGQPEDGRVIAAPAALNWQVGVPHGFVATTDGAVVYNILKNPPEK